MVATSPPTFDHLHWAHLGQRTEKSRSVGQNSSHMRHPLGKSWSVEIQARTRGLLSQILAGAKKLGVVWNIRVDFTMLYAPHLFRAVDTMEVFSTLLSRCQNDRA